MVLGTTFIIPEIGARKFFILVIAGQILAGMIVSHYGLKMGSLTCDNSSKSLNIFPLGF
jgi:uncharacterized membrane protein YdcZ (DUF606 family)